MYRAGHGFRHWEPCDIESLPGGWLVRLAEDAEPGPAISRITLDLRDANAPTLEMVGQFGCWRRDISPRHAEILHVLATHRQGRSAPELAADLYGDRSRVVTVRAEISRLRKQFVGLVVGKPYRFPESAIVDVCYPDDMAKLLASSTAPAIRAARALYVEPVTEDVDIEASGLLDGLEGDARAERAELIEWLLEEGFSVERIKEEVAPMLLPAGRVVGDDGVRVSARQISEETGIDLELLEASSAPWVCRESEDPDAASTCGPTPRPRHAQGFHRSGANREQVITVSRVLGQGLAQTAEVMR